MNWSSKSTLPLRPQHSFCILCMEGRLAMQAQFMCLPLLVAPACISICSLRVQGILLSPECFCCEKETKKIQESASMDVSWDLLSRLCMQLGVLIHTADKRQQTQRERERERGSEGRKNTCRTVTVCRMYLSALFKVVYSHTSTSSPTHTPPFVPPRPR